MHHKQDKILMLRGTRAWSLTPQIRQLTNQPRCQLQSSGIIQRPPLIISCSRPIVAQYRLITQNFLLFKVKCGRKYHNTTGTFNLFLSLPSELLTDCACVSGLFELPNVLDPRIETERHPT
ncbi:hypothetical protein FHG87_010116 [Trinorchestia longiramus]|nr:hypothetical protein FHG87_010116 [Trinorchestia longiramus]